MDCGGGPKRCGDRSSQSLALYVYPGRGLAWLMLCGNAQVRRVAVDGDKVVRERRVGWWRDDRAVGEGREVSTQSADEREMLLSDRFCDALGGTGAVFFFFKQKTAYEIET